jgi:2-methylcitrate dehydratase PrpD
VTVTEQWADYLFQIGREPLPDALRDHVARHVFDTLGAVLAGLPLPETTALSGVVGELNGAATNLSQSGLQGPLGATILHLCAAVRCTEVDDIHLASCTTPSSIIVPTALVTAAHRPEITGDQFLIACLTGYEAVIRLGLAIDGPGILYKGIWPTYLCAAIGSAATTAKLIQLTTAQTAQALAIAASTSAGANARSDSPCSKWLMAGAAAQNGALAAFAAQRGFLGDLGLLGERWGKLFGISVNTDALTQSENGRLPAESLAMKSWCGARQAMSALAGFKQLIATKSVAPESLREITVEVPKAYIQMIDRPSLPQSRQESFANLRYLFGLAAYAPDGLYDVARENLRIDDRFAALAGKIRIAHGPDLDAHYPRHWPARVSVIDGAGTKQVEEVIHAPGDAESPLDWNALITKVERISGCNSQTIEKMAQACQHLTTTGDMNTLITLVEQEIRVTS